MTAPKKISVAIADDHALFRAGVKTGLSSRTDVEIVAEAENGIQLLELLKHIKPDVILLDIQMPKMDGLATLPELKKQYPDIKVIILSMHNDHSVITRMMEIGANSYLTKDSDSEIIYQAIRTCYEQEFYFNDLTNKALLHGLHMKHPITQEVQDVALNEKEVTILKLMCEEKTTREIAAAVDVSPRTVAAIEDKLKTKTGVKSLAGLLMYAIKAGIVKQDDDGWNYILANLPKEQTIKLYSLSTSILAYINHDLGGQRTTLNYSLQTLQELEKKKNTEDVRKEKDYWIAKALEATSSIDSITKVIKTYANGNKLEKPNLRELFISSPKSLIKLIQERNKSAEIIVHEKASTAIEIVYPTIILHSIFSELVHNALKKNPEALLIIFYWHLKGNTFRCEVHDNGPGFEGVSEDKPVPVESLPSQASNISGLGLKIINRTILDSGGHFFISKSKLLRGAMVFFEFPVLDFKYA